MISQLIVLFTTGTAGAIWSSIIKLGPIWIPILFLLVWWDTWLHWRRREWIKSRGNALLEIKFPREMSKSPQAMELFLNTLYNTTTGSLINVYWNGAVRYWYSLELVSIGGTIHFYIWCTGDYKNRIQTQLYAQYPNIEIHEVADYTLGVHWNPEELIFGWMSNFVPTKAEAYPIRTYIDYGLSEDPKEEFKHDPIVSVLEYLGSLKKGEQAWIQILIRGHAKEGLKLGRILPKPDWKGGIEKEIKAIVAKASFKPDEQKQGTFLNLSKGQQDVVAAIERNASKTPFDTMIRAFYFAEKESFTGTNIGGLIGSITQFNSSALNGFRPGWNVGYEYPWQDFHGRNRARNERLMLEAYKRRSIFDTPFKNFHNKPYVMSTEELATIYHFPGEVAATPTLSRIPSKKAEAPTNLPI